MPSSGDHGRPDWPCFQASPPQRCTSDKHGESNAAWAAPRRRRAAGTTEEPALSKGLACDSSGREPECSVAPRLLPDHAALLPTCFQACPARLPRQRHERPANTAPTHGVACCSPPLPDPPGGWREERRDLHPAGAPEPRALSLGDARARSDDRSVLTYAREEPGRQAGRPVGPATKIHAFPRPAIAGEGSEIAAVQPQPPGREVAPT